MLAIVDQGTTTIHQRDFATAAASDRGIDTAIVAAKAMARTALELMSDAALRVRVRAEHHDGGLRPPSPLGTSARSAPLREPRG